MSIPKLEGSVSPLQREFDFYLSNQKSLVEEHDGKVIVVKDCHVIGVYDDELDALNDAKKKHELGTFLVQRVSTGDRDSAHTFHSRVAFS